ncbi:hypothetical protein GN956_G10359 [Arapaima gigas]
MSASLRRSGVSAGVTGDDRWRGLAGFRIRYLSGSNQLLPFEEKQTGILCRWEEDFCLEQEGSQKRPRLVTFVTPPPSAFVRC